MGAVARATTRPIGCHQVLDQNGSNATVATRAATKKPMAVERVNGTIARMAKIARIVSMVLSSLVLPVPHGVTMNVATAKITAPITRPGAESRRKVVSIQKTANRS